MDATRKHLSSQERGLQHVYKGCVYTTTSLPTTTIMVKSKEDVIAEFNETVNMSAAELQAWLDNPMSTKAGTGVGLESAAKIIEILKKNPSKDPDKYDEVRVSKSL